MILFLDLISLYAYIDQDLLTGKKVPMSTRLAACVQVLRGVIKQSILYDKALLNNIMYFNIDKQYVIISLPFCRSRIKLGY